ncbi:MAG: SdpA family antimicrobial peptide system protein [Cyclobacteriaceae bacterium]|nr:SdpA family antimicrobial peptide system protein [Cyclobacteriaceae bacterium]
MRSLVLLFKLLIAFSWVWVIGLVAASYLPHNPLSPSHRVKVIIQAFFPQGWGFFTRNPRDVEGFVYFQQDTATYLSALRIPNAAAVNLLGLRRDSRTQGAEYGLLLSQLEKDTSIWVGCKGLSHIECIKFRRDISAIKVSNNKKKPTLCGPIWIIVQEPVPWAWYQSAAKMPLKLVKLDVECLN